MAFEPFDYGKVLQTREEIKGARLQNALAQQQQDPSSVYSQQQQANLDLSKQRTSSETNELDEKKKLQNVRELFLSNSRLSQEPDQSVVNVQAREIKRLQGLGILPPDYAPETNDPIKIKADAKKELEHIKLQMGLYQDKGQQSGGGMAAAIQIANAYKAADPTMTDKDALDRGAKAWQLQNLGDKVVPVNAADLARQGQASGQGNAAGIGSALPVFLAPKDKPENILAAKNAEKQGELNYAAPIKTATELGEAKGKAITDYPKVIESGNYLIDILDRAKKHPGLKYAIGATSLLPIPPGTDAAGFKAIYDQIGGANFLKAYEALKGGGQITVIEGEKGTAAIARMSRAQKEEDFIEALTELQGIVRRGMEKAAASAGKESAQAQAGGQQQAAPGNTKQSYKVGDVVTSPSGKKALIQGLGSDGKPNKFKVLN